METLALANVARGDAMLKVGKAVLIIRLTKVVQKTAMGVDVAS